jgi:hypothetical protein
MIQNAAAPASVIVVLKNVIIQFVLVGVAKKTVVVLVSAPPLKN